MVGDSIQAIIKLKDLFLGLLARAAAAFTRILSNPLSFISNFMGAVKQGFMNFAGNILEHLKKGLQGWLFGQLASAGIELPDKFDLKGIIKLIASMLGLTWGSIKARIVAKAPWIGQAIDFIESKIEVFVILATQGVAGIWNWIKDKVGDLKEMVFGQIKTFVVEKIVKAGITWVLGMLNPAGALIKIVQALISVVQWIMERGAQMSEFIGTVIDAVMDIARGGGGGVPAKIEGALAKAVPLVISFLAGLLGLGGISEKIKSILQAAQRPVGKAIDAVVGAALKGAKKLIGFGKKAKDKIKSLFSPVIKNFGMKSDSHQLTAAPGPPFQLTMASNNAGRLVSRIEYAIQLLKRKSPEGGDQLAALADLRQFAIIIEKTGKRAERGDNHAAKRLEAQLSDLSSRITAYANRFNAKDLDDLDPANDVELTIRQAEAAGNKKRLSAIDLAIIRLQIERVMGPAWKDFASTLGPNTWTLTRESLVAVYGKAEAERLIKNKNNPLEGKGLYDPRRNQLFIKMGRSITEVASSIIHEGTHSLQTQLGGEMERFEKEFQAFSVQRDFFRRLSGEAQAKLPENYQKLLRCDTDEKLRDFVAGKYPNFKVVNQLKERTNGQFIKQMVKREFGQ